MNIFDEQRIENAVWTLLQYQDDIENMATDMKLNRYEVEAMFNTLSYVHANISKNIENDGFSGGI